MRELENMIFEKSATKFRSRCDFVVLEADGTCRIVAAHSSRKSLRPGKSFFSAVGATGEEQQFALRSLLDDPGRFVMIRTDSGPVLLSGYYYLSVRLFFALVLHVEADSAARVAVQCYPEILRSPSLVGSDIAFKEEDEDTYALLQPIRQCLRDVFAAPFAADVMTAEEAVRSAYRMARAWSELLGRSFHMSYPSSEQKCRVRYDPVIGSLFFLVFFCYADRVAPERGTLFSVTAEPAPRLELSEIADNLADAPELDCLMNLDCYSRQQMDIVCSGNQVTLRLFLARSEEVELLGLKNRYGDEAFDRQWIHFELTCNA